jgi:hypothetical protein
MLLLVRAVQRADFAVRFGQCNLTGESPRALANLRQQVARFLAGPAVRKSAPIAPLDQFCAVPSVDPLGISVRDLQALQSRARGILVHALGMRAPAGDAADTSTVPLSAEWSVLGATQEKPGMVQVRGTLIDVFTLTLFHLFAAGWLHHVSPCPECGTLFVRIRRQKYCRRRCVNHANLRAWRARRGRTRINEDARKAYARRIKARLGAATHVGR